MKNFIKFVFLITIILFPFISGCKKDTEPPEVEIVSPQNNANVYGVVEIEADVSDNVGVSDVKFYIDDVKVFTDNKEPYKYSWNTDILTDSSYHTIFVIATDVNNNEGYSDTISVRIVRPDQGILKWTFTMGDVVRSSPAIGSDGTIYVGSDDYKLYAIYGSGTLANTPWPMFHHDLKHTGRVGGGFRR
uniref:Uncharacterized protein n=1 Tax=candidate division WOR-3 bacterium TaxID=2052148 RepID=A0A7C4U7K1_UNCW3